MVKLSVGCYFWVRVLLSVTNSMTVFKNDFDCFRTTCHICGRSRLYLKIVPATLEQCGCILGQYWLFGGGLGFCLKTALVVVR